MSTITDQDIRRQVTDAVEANGADLAEGIDVDGIVRDIQDAYGLVDVETIDADEFWAIVANHDVTQADEVTTSAWNADTRCWEVVERESAADAGTDLDNADLSADDMGCEPGTVYRVALVRNDNGAEREIRAVEVTALGAVGPGPRVTLTSIDDARALVDLPQLAGNGHRLDRAGDGRTVHLTSDALAALADLDSDSDGHYDGVYVWVGGTEYAVVGQ